MDALPSTSTRSPPKKRKRLDLGHLSLAEKQCIINMYKHLLSDKPEIKITEVVSNIVETIGVAKPTVYRTIKEYREIGDVTNPQQAGGRPGVIATYEEYVKDAVRGIVYAFFCKNEIPTLNKVLNEINSRTDLPQMSRSSLHKFIKQLNFKYLKRNRKSVSIEHGEIIRWRRNYLTTIKQYIYYLVETWVNEGHTKGKVWLDCSITNQRQAFIEGLSTGLKSPSGKGKRLIILHIGSEQGFVNDGLLYFEGKKFGDYHQEMNAKVFEEWFDQILKKLPENSVIVMDNAPYHSRKVERIPTTSSKKKDMQKWLELKGIEFDQNMVRSELLHLIRQNKSKYNLYKVDEMAKQFNKIVLRLPPYHCELNPIEMIWAQIKNEVASKNCTFKLNEVKELLLQAVQNVTSLNWKNCVEHIIKEEAKMCKLDGIMDNVIEPLIISLNADSDTSSSENSDDD